ncbi:MAG: type II secretion system protein GspG [Chlorobia bacterium]|nr:type II secretion system protein GspG [Fimbriimonadaceae bacterium]
MKSGVNWLVAAFGIFVGMLVFILLTPRMVRHDGPRRSKPASDISSLRGMVQIYRQDIGHYPETLADLRTKPAIGATGWRGPYMDTDIPSDPWGNEYDYQLSSDGEKFSIISYGRDGAPGGEGDDADIGREVSEGS